MTIFVQRGSSKIIAKYLSASQISADLSLDAYNWVREAIEPLIELHRQHYALCANVKSVHLKFKGHRQNARYTPYACPTMLWIPQYVCIIMYIHVSTIIVGN